MSKQAVAKKTTGAVAGYDYGEHSGVGFEGTTPNDLSIPFLSILQSNSPQVENGDPAGAKSGMLFNTVTRELIDGEEGGVVFLPCHKEMAYVEWVPRAKGGGFVGLHLAESDEVKKAISANDGKRIGKLAIGDNELVETYYVYGLVLNHDGSESLGFAVISFTSTKIKPFRDWVTAMYTLKHRPPMFANRARIRTVKQRNELGTFCNFRIDPLRATWSESLIDPVKESNLLEEAVGFRDMVVNGIARAAFETQDATGDGSPAATGGEEAPF